MKSKSPRLSLSILMLFMFIGAHNLSAQVFVQIERFNNPKSIKFSYGDRITFNTNQFPDYWRTEVIEDILIDANTLVLNGEFFKLEDLNQIKIQKPWALQLGLRLQQFGIAWYLYGGIIYLADDDFDWGWDTVAIGGISIAIGTLLRSRFGYKTYTIGKKCRLRIVDVRFPAVPYKNYRKT